MEDVKTGITNLELAKKAYELFVEGNIPAFMALHRDEVVYEIMGEPDISYAGTYRGKEEVLTLFQKIDDVIEFIKFEPVEFITEGDHMAVVVDTETRIKSNNKIISRDLVQILTFKDGMLLRLRDYFDTNHFLKSFN